MSSPSDYVYEPTPESPSFLDDPETQRAHRRSAPASFPFPGLEDNPPKPGKRIPHEDDTDSDEDDDDDDDDDPFEAPVRSRLELLSRWLDRFSIGTRAILCILPVGLILTALGLLDVYVLYPPVYIAHVPLRWWCMYLGVQWASYFLSLLVVAIVPRIMDCILGALMASTKQWLSYLKHHRSDVASIICAAVANLTWSPIVIAHARKEHWYMERVHTIFHLILISLILLTAERLALTIIAVSFHKTTYKFRITRNNNKIKMVDMLLEAIVIRQINEPVSAIPAQTRKPTSLGPTMAMSCPTTGAFLVHSQSNYGTVPSSPPGTPGRPVIRHSNTAPPGVDRENRRRRRARRRRKGGFGLSNLLDHATTALENITADMPPQEAGSAMSMCSTGDAHRVARRLYEGLLWGEGDRDEVELKDFLRLSCFASKWKAEEAFDVFDRNHNGSLTAEEVRDTLLQLYKERKSFRSSMRDLDHVVARLHEILIVVVYVIIMIVTVSFFEEEATKYITMLASFLLALSFMMGSTATAFFESVVFLFVQHPYDVGDLIDVDGIEYRVREMQLLTSVLEQSDGTMVLAPNAHLAQKFIRNHRRSTDEKEVILIDLDFDTSDRKIHELNRRMSAYLRTHRRDYKDELDLTIMEIWRSSRIKIELSIPYRGNTQDEKRKIERRNRFLLHLKRVLAELDINYQGDLQRVRLVEGARGNATRRKWHSKSEGLNREGGGLESSGSTLAM